MHKIRKIICISIMCIGCLLMTILLGGVTSIENEIIMAAGSLYNQSGSGSATNLSAEVEAYYTISSTPGTSDSTGSGTISGGVAGNIPKEARKAYLFPNGVPQTESAMRTYLTTISVPINDIFGNTYAIGRNLSRDRDR